MAGAGGDKISEHGRVVASVDTRADIVPKPSNERSGLSDVLSIHAVSGRKVFDLSMDVNGDKFDFDAAFGRFVSSVAADFKVDPSGLLKDQEFKASFVKLLQFEIDLKSRRLSKEDYVNLRRFVVSRLTSLKREKSEFEPHQLYRTFTKLERDRNLGMRINKVYATQLSPEKTAKLAFWKAQNYTLEKRFAVGEITLDKYLEERDKLTEDVVEQSGDEELKEDFEAYEQDQKNDEFADFLEIPKAVSEIKTEAQDKPILDQSIVKESFNEVSSAGMDINFSGGNSATVVIDNQLPIDVGVFRDENSNEIVYYLKDNYVDSGVVRVKAGELLAALDNRHIDSYLSMRVNESSIQHVESISDVSDESIATVGGKLLGKGSDRSFSFSLDDKRVLDKIAILIVSPDVKYPSFERKMDALKIYLNSKDRIFAARKLLLTGDVVSISSLIESIA